MISLFPDRASTQPAERIEPETFDAIDGVDRELRPRQGERPWLMSNMIMSADGATAINGLSGELGGPADFEMFMALRSMCDAIIVGAATVTEEDYQAPGPGSERAQAGRAERGQAPRPRLVIVTGSLSLDPSQRVFADPDNRPLIATVTSAPIERRQALAEVAEIIDLGEDHVALPSLLDELGRRGLDVVMSEGGPSLNGQLIADDLFDEWNLTISPILATGQSRRPAQGPELPQPPAPMTLSRVWQADELLFCRWIRR